MRWLISTLPAPTAAGGSAATNVPDGATTSTGRIAPPLEGIVGSVALRRANPTQLTVTAAGAFTLPGRWRSVPEKSKITPSPASVTSTAILAATCWDGRGPTLSITSSNRQVPSGSPARAARIRRSP